VIRDKNALNRIREYILHNPGQWQDNKIIRSNRNRPS